ncbi:MAG: HD domain-containing protein [Catenisphaera adipataccumulans]|uniref:HD domain-containing protein n=1 Tax=Catenisphaera adipataccumulans TaxID=700500 RepID=UPI003D8BF3D5
MFERTKETKVLRDPIHGYIHIRYRVIWNCLNSREFQRLHRIHQLGGDFQVYHAAEHSRFGHSLGVYEVCRRMVTEVDSIAGALSESEKIAVMAAALLHDLGHGPYSHFFESIQDISHEERTMRIIADPASEVHQALTAEDEKLPQEVIRILKHEHQRPILNQMISSQLDADRMDYLLRDAYETGTSYGTFDLERVLRTLRICDDMLCVKQSGMHSIEDYIMARYHMYWQVYLHPDAKSYEMLLATFFKRYMEINEPIEVFEPLRHPLSNEEFFLMDECRMMYGFQCALNSKDAILRDFADRILNRRLFAWIENPNEDQIRQLEERLKDRPYYLIEEPEHKGSFLPYSEERSKIWILTNRNELKPLSQCSEIVRALLKMEDVPEKRIFYPKDIEIH